MAKIVFRLPDLAEGLEDAEVAEWYIGEGDEVKLNQPLGEMQTAKATVEMPSPYAGRVVRLHAAPGELVKVGEPLVTFEVPDTASPGDAILVGRVPGEPAARRVRLRKPGSRLP
jgi:pyruvate dehydrogenase E2 component (dihydrolipoamide acetyltransferase)